MALVTGLPTLLTKQVESMSETLFEGFFADPLLTSLVTVQQDIKADKQLIVFQRHTGLSGKNVTACPTPTNSTWGFNTIEKTWQPKYIGDRYAECYQTFMATFTQWMLNAGVNKSDFTNTELAGFILEQMQDMLAEVMQRMFWFGDKGIVAGTNNNLTSGQLAFFNSIDGIWAQLFDIVTADSARYSTTGLNTYNIETTYADQKFDATATTNQVAGNALDSLWYDADMRLRGMSKSDLAYYVTQSVYDQLEKERKAVGGIDLPYNRQEAGISGLTWNGIQILPIQLWDRMIASYFGNDATPTYSYLPHRALLSTKSNLLLGVETTGSLSELDAWYSRDDEKMYAKFGAMVDAKVALDNMVQVAY
jgi:hypothetical protein